MVDKDTILSPPPPQSTLCEISVIIPAYNGEKYIGECLDSLVAQTFQDFEVVVIDDASGDNTCAVVENYREKFGERLKIIHMEENSGHPSEPRNIGIAGAKGEYIYCLDSDDTLTETALEEMYSLAKKFDADVVYCEKYFMSEGFGQEFKDKIHLADNRIQRPPFVEEPTLETDNLAERVKNLLNCRYWMSPALRLVKRNLLIENKIKFPSLIGSEDDVWSMEVLFCSNRFLRIPNICFVRRIHKDGISFGETTPEHVQEWMDGTIRSLKDFDNFINGIDFFRENPQFRYDILNHSVSASFSNVFKKCATESDFDICNIFQEKLGNSLVEHNVLVSCLCAYAVAQHKKLAQDTRRLIDEQAEEIRQFKAKLEAMTPLPALWSNVPAVSVIIPMYNREKYIGECLDSLVGQTFQDFEVIVVDDCSTDNSCAIVRNYMAKFNGRLRLEKTEKNSGGGATPRNIGIKIASGEYILFVDSDDFIMLNALETLYNAAKEYDAEVVYYSSYYVLSEPINISLCRDDEGNELLKKGLEDKPTLILNDPGRILQRLCSSGKEGNLRSSYTKFVRRDFLLRNKIFFPPVTYGEDFIWCINVYCHAKRFLRIPNTLYFYRNDNVNSVCNVKREPLKQVSVWFSDFINWAKYLGELEKEHKILSDNPAYGFTTATDHFNWCLYRMDEARKELGGRKIYEILRRKLLKENDSSSVLLPLLISVIDDDRKEIAEDKEKLDAFKSYFTARIDVHFVPKTGMSNFEIVSISDDKAKVMSATWLPKDTIGYSIESYTGKLEITVKLLADGQISLYLMGLWVPNPEDTSKLIPYWIDYTKLTINDKGIFDKLTPAWHDKPSIHKFEVKADEEIKIQVEWLPHRSDT